MDATNFIVRVSSICDLKCHYCFARRDFTGATMSRKMLAHVIREIDSLGLSSVQMSWHGGEPLMLGIEQFEHGVKVQKSLKTSFCNTVQTNGTHINNAYADFFAKNCFGVGISIDGPKEVQNSNRPIRNGQGSFDQAIRGLRLLQSQGLDVSCISVITDYCQPGQYFEFIKGLGLSSFAMKPCSGDWEHSMNLWQYTDFIREVYHLVASSDQELPNCREFMGYAENILSGTSTANLCLQSGNCGCFVMIDTNGDVFPCDELTTEEFCWGNLTEKPLKEILESVERQQFLKRVDHQNEMCKNGCEAFDACRGGCTSCHINFKGSEYCDCMRSTIKYIRQMVIEGVDQWLDPNDERVKILVDPKLLA